MKIVFFVEEPSMYETLNGVLPRLLPAEVAWQCIPHEGKTDLLKSIPRKLRGWREPDVCFVVLCDQDMQDCLLLKQRIVDICCAAGRPKTLVRIVCRMLEAWFLADLRAVSVGLENNKLTGHQSKQKFRTPDNLPNPAGELEALAKNYHKVAGARAISTHLDLENTRSTSFRAFVLGVQNVVNEGCHA